MNEQQLQQILTIQQAIAAAATAAVINSLLNPQQAAAANLTNQSALSESPAGDNDSHEQRLPDSRQGSPLNSNSPTANNQIDTNNRTIQDLLLQLQQQQQQANVAGAGVGAGAPVSNNQIPNIAQAAAALNFNLNNQLSAQQNLAGSPLGRLLGQNDFNAAALAAVAAATTSGNIPAQQPPSQSPNLNVNKKQKRHHQPQASPQPFPSQHNNRSSLDATSKSIQQHASSLPKSHSAVPNLASRNNSSGTNSSSTSSTFLPNNVGLPRKLVRGQDVWLGRGAEQTRQILKCMWCGQSFRTLAEMTQHMKVTQHYTNIISQEQLTSWKQPESNELAPSRPQNKQAISSRNVDDLHDTSSEKFNDSDKDDDSFSNDEEPPQRSKTKSRPGGTAANKSADRSKVKREFTSESKSSPQQAAPVTKPAPLRTQKRPLEDDGESSTEGDISSMVNTSVSSDKVKSGAELREDESESDANVERKASSPQDYSKAASDDERETKTEALKGRASCDEGQKKDDEITENGGEDNDTCKSSNDRDDARESKIDQSADEADRDDDKQSRMNEDEEINEEDLNNGDDCDKTTKRRGSQERDQAVALKSSGVKQILEGQKGAGTGDPLSALETMVEKSFDPRMRPGMASGGILQRLGIDEEVMPPWQHINYANWYAAAAYGHPMAAALFAAGMNLNGIKLSKNMNPKKSDD